MHSFFFSISAFQSKTMTLYTYMCEAANAAFANDKSIFESQKSEARKLNKSKHSIKYKSKQSKQSMYQLTYQSIFKQ